MTTPPRILTHFNLMVNGGSFAGKIDEIRLPVLEMETMDYRSGGMDTSVPIAKGMKKLETTLVISDYDLDILTLFGFNAGGPVSFAANGSLQSPGLQIPVIATFRGIIRKLDMGTWKANEDTKTTLDVDVTYYRLEIAGQKVYEIDPLNMVRFINGSDELAVTRAILNL